MIYRLGNTKYKFIFVGDMKTILHTIPYSKDVLLRMKLRLPIRLHNNNVIMIKDSGVVTFIVNIGSQISALANVLESNHFTINDALSLDIDEVIKLLTSLHLQEELDLLFTFINNINVDDSKPIKIDEINQYLVDGLIGVYNSQHIGLLLNSIINTISSLKVSNSLQFNVNFSNNLVNNLSINAQNSMIYSVEITNIADVDASVNGDLSLPCASNLNIELGLSTETSILSQEMIRIMIDLLISETQIELSSHLDNSINDSLVIDIKNGLETIIKLKKSLFLSDLNAQVLSVSNNKMLDEMDYELI